jgi:hypothetical protein
MDIPQISIREIKPINIEGGYLIDGFPSTGYTSATRRLRCFHHILLCMNHYTGLLQKVC